MTVWMVRRFWVIDRYASLHKKNKEFSMVKQLRR